MAIELVQEETKPEWVWDPRVHCYLYGDAMIGAAVFEERNGWYGRYVYKNMAGQFGGFHTVEEAEAECVRMLKIPRS